MPSGRPEWKRGRQTFSIDAPVGPGAKQTPHPVSPFSGKRRESKRLLFDWRRVLVYTHRWLGIAGGVLFIIWFASGIVMMYARMPRLTPEERLLRLPPLDLAAARVAPAEAARASGVSVERVRIGMLRGRPVYRFFDGRRWTTVFADNAERLEHLTASDAVSLVTSFLPEHASTIRHHAYLTDSDQWTFSVRALMPVHRVAAGDAADTYVYVSEQTGEAVMKTTRSERSWGYLGAVLHWIYFTPFRRHATLWAQSIIWLSIAGCVMCLSGLAWGIWRYSRSRRYRLKHVHSHSPYAGLMKWHHYAGLIFGLATFTWILSGLLSMDPWNWHPGTAPTDEQQNAVSGGPLRLDLLPLDRIREGVAAVGSSFTPKELDVVQLQGEPFLVAYRAPWPPGADRWPDEPLEFLSPALALEHRLVSAVTPDRGAFARFDDGAMFAAARAAMPGATVADAEWLQEYDAYYYDRYGARPLPVLRVRFADPQRTWLYLDPQRGLIALKEERLSRLNRWLYHGLHSFDFPVLYYRRPLWDIILLALSLGGIVVSASTMLAAWHRLRRHARHLARRIRGTAA